MDGYGAGGLLFRRRRGRLTAALHPARPLSDHRAMTQEAPPGASRASRAATVAAGILTSRVVGFLRERAVAHFFGVGAHADVFQAAFRTPNLLQNLLGEGTISAAFIPVYSRMLEEGRERDAGRFAGAIFGLLLAAAAAISLLGVVFARPIVAVLTPGFIGDAARVAAGELSVDRFALTAQAVKLVFPMTGLLVLSAWALGVLNSHRRFFLPYFAPVLWNAAVIAALVGAARLWVAGAPTPGAGPSPAVLDRLLLAACVGGMAGGLLQFAVQVPLVAREMRGFRLSFSTAVPGVSQALRAFGPVVAGRGVYQLSTYLDIVLASLLAAGALGALRYAQVLYVLPVSLFGLSVAASELPELSRLGAGDADADARFAGRLQRSLGQMLFFTLPTTAGFLAFGFLLVGAIFATGSFALADNWLVYLALVGYTFGLPATTASRLLQNAFYARSDTRTPAKIAVVRVAVGAAAALPLMLWSDRFPLAGLVGTSAAGHPLYLGAAGLAAASGFGAWSELLLLRHALRSRLPGLAFPRGAIGRMSALSAGALVPAALLWWVLPPWHIALRALLVVGVYGLGYLGGAHLLGLPQMAAWTARLRRRRAG
jgi:putative peptidoglycan lipid II flippase